MLYANNLLKDFHTIDLFVEVFLGGAVVSQHFFPSPDMSGVFLALETLPPPHPDPKL